MPVVSCSSTDAITWEHTGDVMPALQGNVHIWRLQLSAHAHLTAAVAPVLNAEEAAQAARYHQEKDSRRFVLARATLRLILAGYTCLPAKEVAFITGGNKKPRLQTNISNLHYNVAHAGDWVLIAVSDRAVGVDTEQTADELQFTDILNTCCSADEARFIQTTPNDKDWFYKCWTRKEALVKATGKGIDDDLAFVPCMDGAHEAATDKIGSDKDWSVLSFPIAAQNIASVAYDPAISRIAGYEVSGILGSIVV